MCTALWDRGGGLFGRTLDLEYTYDEQVVVAPGGLFGGRYRMVGMATVVEGYPLYYDGVNERGLAMAGLHFPRSGVYPPPQEGAKNVGSYALLPTVLSRCATVEEATALLRRIHLCDRAFSHAYPATSLHWMLADPQRAVVVESTTDGVQAYDNPVGVMTNEPPFPHQLTHLSHFAHLSPNEPTGQWQSPVSRGSGTLGMPGDYSSPSRFVRGAFGVAHSAAPHGDAGRVGQFFRLMGTVEVPCGWVRAQDGRWVMTHYTACMDLQQPTYYYRTYGCHRITAVPLPATAGDGLLCYPLRKQADILWER